jgi:hypothetical protein
MYLSQILAYCHKSQEKFRLAYSHCLHNPIGKDKSYLRLACCHCPHLFRRKTDLWKIKTGILPLSYNQIWKKVTGGLAMEDPILLKITKPI